MKDKRLFYYGLWVMSMGMDMGRGMGMGMKRRGRLCVCEGRHAFSDENFWGLADQCRIALYIHSHAHAHMHEQYSYARILPLAHTH